MTATVLLHPASRDLMAAVDWGFAMAMGGYDVRPRRLSNGDMTLIARPKENVHTNANRIKMPRFYGQFGATKPDDLPPSAA